MIGGNYIDYYWEALRLALMYHKGQQDKAGKPYVEHPIRVFEYVRDSYGSQAYPEIIVALLHDIVEDTECTLKILSMFFPESIVNAVDAITHRHDEKNETYLRRVSRNFAASRVKLCDIKDNTDPVRLLELHYPINVRLLEKYRKSLSTLIRVSDNHAFRELAKTQLEATPDELKT